MSKKVKIAIIGGGVAGVTSALYLGQQGLEVTLFEKESSLVNGPPFCHLHAGGNLYREISDEQCIKLLKQSIDFAKFYPFVVDYRPTVIALPTTDKGNPSSLLPRLELLKEEYRKLIESDEKNSILGDYNNYFKLYTKEEIEALKSKKVVTTPQSCDEWMIPVAHNIDLEHVQFPLIMVQEYGLNLFRLGAGAMLALEKEPNVTLYTQTVVNNIEKTENQWSISYQDKKEEFDYIINASGFRTGKIDDMLNVPCRRMVEFKAAYVSQWQEHNTTLFPEIIFHGERGTPQGMGQFTPYPNGYFQLHGMTHEITLYEGGLVSNSDLSCQPELSQEFIEKIEKSWRKEEVTERTIKAIEHLSQFIPNFSSATVGSKPLFGAQQIPGDDPTLRVAEVSFPIQNYARCEIVKVSSVIDMMDRIIKEFIRLNYLKSKKEINYLQNLTEKEVTEYAQQIAKERDYPADLARRNVSRGSIGDNRLSLNSVGSILSNKY